MATPTTVTSSAILTALPAAAVDEDASPAAAEQHVVVECPAWCERDQEHDSAENLEHLVNHHEVDGPTLIASLVTYCGCDLFEIHLGEHTTVKLRAQEAGKLIAVLAELMALSTRTWKKRTVLGGEEQVA
jgi:hypothetical protein